MRRVIFLLTVFSICCSINFAQVFNAESSMPLKKLTKDWSVAIDTTWGEGLTTADKLNFFDTWWNRIDQRWGGFPNLIINWDSLKIYYRPIIEAGISQGRFQGILTRLTRALNEGHTRVVNPDMDIKFGFYYDQYGEETEYPNFQSYIYKPDIPLLNLSYLFRTNFGAGVTAYEDSIALIYSVMSNHPLNIEPGDIILGYDGLPWNDNLEDLLDQELPLLFGRLGASTQESEKFVKVISAGWNWGLFDTIDILKYSTGDTVHLPTSLLDNMTKPYFIETQQLPINGVPLPNLSQDQVVSWGIVEGTSIGYINVWDWYTGSVATLFEQAVDELMHLHNITGLILDFRVNQGGFPDKGNGGFKHLFNEDPTSNFSNAVRIPGNDHFLFNITPTNIFMLPFEHTPELFDHPIAVLIGPLCASAGDYNSFRLRFHPMARFFGKKTTGAFVSYDYWPNVYFSMYNYRCRMDNGCMYSNFNNEGFMIHKGCPVDEEVWLTRDGVVNGQDDVVNSAIEWINNVVYPHDIFSNKKYYSSVEDTVHLSTVIENPNSHQISARAYLSNIEGDLIDSVNLAKQTLYSQGEQWTGNCILTPEEETYKVSVRVFDETELDQFIVPNAIRFTTLGPIVLDSINIIKVQTYYVVKTFLKNLSTNTTITNASVKLICDDPWALPITTNIKNLPDIPPGVTVNNLSGFRVMQIDSLFPGYFNFKVEVMSDGWAYWSDSMQVIVTGVEREETLPTECALLQNYPNPFNPSTVISWESPVGSHQTIKVFDVLGNEVATLVDEYKPAGKYEVEFDASRLASGVYFYKLQAGDFVSVKKMILVK